MNEIKKKKQKRKEEEERNRHIQNSLTHGTENEALGYACAECKCREAWMSARRDLSSSVEHVTATGSMSTCSASCTINAVYAIFVVVVFFFYSI